MTIASNLNTRGNGVLLVGDHDADTAQAVPGARANYLLYVRSTRRAWIAALATSALFAPRVWLGLNDAFSTSASEGWADVRAVAYVALGGLTLIIAVGLACWIPALIRTAILARRMPGARLFLVRPIPNFWGRLSLIDPSHEIGRRIPNATISFQPHSVTIWRGVLRPRVVAELPVRQLINVETDRPTGTPFKRRIMLLTFALGSITEEIPIAFRRLSGLGLLRVSQTTEREIASRLNAFRD